MNQSNPYKKADRFTEAAKKAGYPARSVYKLEEIDRRARILRRGQSVVDLGAAPGSWSKYVSEKIGEKGRLLAIDRQELRTALPAWCTFIEADCFELDGAHYTEFGPFDVVLSDMAPNTSGNRFSDQAKSTELFLHAVEVARAHGAPGSSFVGKIFMGEDFPAALGPTSATAEPGGILIEIPRSTGVCPSGASAVTFSSNKCPVGSGRASFTCAPPLSRSKACTRA